MKGLTGSLNRPDFAILPDGTVGLYGLAKYDDQGAEIGIDRLTITRMFLQEKSQKELQF